MGFIDHWDENGNEPYMVNEDGSLHELTKQAEEDTEDVQAALKAEEETAGALEQAGWRDA